MKIFKKAKRGFTLVELVVVIAVIAILAAVSVGAYFGITDSANKSKLESEARGVLTNIQLIANGNDSNCYMDREAVHIKEVDAFERKLNGMSGIDYEVTTEMPTSISKETVYLINTKEDQPSNAPNDTFGTYYRFGYYTPDVGGKCAVYTFATQEMKITDANFDVNEEEGGNEGGETATPVESINVTGVGSSIELYVDKLSPQIFVTWEPQEAQIEYRYDSSVISWDTSFIKGLKAGSTNFEILDKANGTVKHSIAVTVKEKTAESLAAISGSAETDYFTGDVFDIGSLKLGIVYSDSPTPVEITDTENIKYSTEPLTKSGNVVLSYAVGTKELTYAIAVTVTPIEIETFVYTGPEITKQFYVGDTFDLTDLTFKAEYNDSRKNKENLTLSDVQAKDTELSLGKNYISYEYEGLECKISIPAVKAVELVSLTAAHENGKPEYNIGDIVTIDGWTVTAEFNNGDIETFTEMVEGLEIYPKEALTAESTHIYFSYKFGEQNPVNTPNLPIHVINNQTFYFETKPWWNENFANTYVQAYKENNEVVFKETFGKKMTEVQGSYTTLTGGTSIWQIDNIDVNDIKKLTFISVVENQQNGTKQAQTRDIEINELYNSELKEYQNIIYLSRNEVNSESRAEVSFGVYKSPLNVNVYLRGLDGTENLLEEYKMSLNEEKTHFTKQILLEPTDTFDIYVEHHISHGWDKLTNESRNFFIKNSNKIETTVASAGLYNVSIDVSNGSNITLEKIAEYDAKIVLAGAFSGNAWNDNYLSDCIKNNNIYTFENVVLKKGDEFKFRLANFDGENASYLLDWDYSNLDSDAKSYFVKDDEHNNIVFDYYDEGTFTFVLNTENNTISVSNPSVNKTIYLEPSVAWLQADARFAAYFFNSNTDYLWVSMSDTNKDNVYEVSFNEKYSNVIFCRMAATDTKNNWDNVWNQTADLVVPVGENTVYEIVEQNDGDFKNDGSWTSFNTALTNEILITFIPCSFWKQSNARFAIYMWNSSGNKWLDIIKISSNYLVSVPNEYKDCKFVRFNPSVSKNGWENGKWNEGANTTLNASKTTYTQNNGWDDTSGSWK